MKVTGWSNGSPTKSGSGYGIRISQMDRDQNFNRQWKKVEIDLEGTYVIEIKITDSFWRKCTELRSSELGSWLIRKGHAPWQRGKPPKFNLLSIGNGKFRLKIMDS